MGEFISLLLTILCAEEDCTFEVAIKIRIDSISDNCFQHPHTLTSRNELLSRMPYYQAHGYKIMAVREITNVMEIYDKGKTNENGETK